MVICHCAAVNDRAIRELAGAASSVEALGSACGAGADCGGCVRKIQRLLDTLDGERDVLVGIGG